MAEDVKVSPLPWTVKEGIGVWIDGADGFAVAEEIYNKADAEFIAKACNSYADMIDIVRKVPVLVGWAEKVCDWVIDVFDTAGMPQEARRKNIFEARDQMGELLKKANSALKDLED